MTEFELVLAKLDRAGNKAAQDIRDALVGLSLHQLFCDAFNLKFEEEDRQAYVKERGASKYVRRTCTNAIQAYIDRNNLTGTSYAKSVYAEATDTLYLGLYGKSAAQLKQERNSKTLRDTFSMEELTKVELLEGWAAMLITNRNIEPVEAIRAALTLNSSKVNPND